VDTGKGRDDLDGAWDGAIREGLRATPERRSGAPAPPAPGAPEEILPAARAERYRLLVDEIPEDGVTRFPGRDLDLGRPVVLTILGRAEAEHEEGLYRFLAEAQILAQLTHPSILPVYGLGIWHDGRPFYTTRPAEGTPLARIIGERRADLPQLLTIFERVCEATAYAHSRGVAHGTLSGDRILAGGHGEVTITGFEEARLVAGPGEFRSDGAALGNLLDAILSGHAEPSLRELRARLTEPLAAVSPDGAAVAAREVDAWLSERERRARDAEVEAAGERARAEAEEASRRLAERRAALARQARRRMAAIAAGVLAALLVAGAWLLLSRREHRAAATRAADAVAAALAEAARHEGAGRFTEAGARLEKAAAIAATGLLDEGTAGHVSKTLAAIRRRNLRALQDEEATARLDGLREATLQPRQADGEAIDADYQDVYLAIGIDVRAGETEETAAALRARDALVPLVAGLENWSFFLGRRPDLPGRDPAHLVTLARLADPDPFRNRLREAILTGAGPEVFRDLAARADPGALPAGSLLLLARQLHRREDRETAIDLLRAARREHMGDPWIPAELALRLIEGPPRQLAEAERYLCAAIALRPRAANLWSILGEVLGHAGQARREIEAYRTAVALRGNHWTALQNLGACLLAAGDLEECLPFLRRAVELRPGPESAFAHVNLADACALLGDGPEGLNVLGRLGTERPPVIRREGYWLSVRGKAHYCAGLHEEARSLLEAADPLLEGDFRSACRVFLAMAMWRLGEEEAARRVFAEARKALQPYRAGDRNTDRLLSRGEALIGGHDGR
jgi:tetratricopeptide (TPR) repeat protein